MRRRKLLRKIEVLALGKDIKPIMCQDLNCCIDATTELVLIIKDTNLDLQIFLCDKHSQTIERVLE